MRLTRAVVAGVGAVSVVLAGGAAVYTASVASAAAPVVVTLDPSDLTASSATFRCSVNAGGRTTSVWASYKPASGRWTAAVNTAKQSVTGTTTEQVSIPRSGLSAATSYDVRCKAKNADAAAVVVANTVRFTTSSGGGGGDVVLAAAGDICDDNPTLFGGIGCRGTGRTIVAQNPDYVVALGDMQYPDFDGVSNDYEVEWDAFKAKTFPVVGNHDVRSDNATAEYHRYWGVAANSGSDYSYREDLGRWSLIAINTNDPVTSARLAALDALLDAAGTDHVALAMHAPFFSSPCDGCHGGTAALKPYVDRAVARGVDLVLTAHDHRYEVFAPMNSSGPAAGGVRHFLLGMGGAHPDGSDLPAGALPGSQYVKGDFVGVTFFRLGDAGYSWSTVQTTSAAGAFKVIDSGSESVR